MLIRSEQVRSMLQTIHQAREIRDEPQRMLHLVKAVHDMLGAAISNMGAFVETPGSRRRRVEPSVVCWPSGTHGETILTALQSGVAISPTLDAMSRRLRENAMLTFRRRDLVADGEWYGSDSFNLVHRAIGCDDHVYSFRRHSGGRVSGLAIRRARGERPFSEEERSLLELFHEEVVRLERTPASGPSLGRRERDVLRLLLSGASEKQVAAELDLSQHTVHSYVKTIYSTYRVQSRAELLVRCLAS
jgi:DNA-binding CsgD family transcriptional regulator